MPRIQVSLPDDLVAEAKARGLNLDAIAEAALRKAVNEAIEDEERERLIAADIAAAKDVVLTEEEEAWVKALAERVQAHLAKRQPAS